MEQRAEHLLIHFVRLKNCYLHPGGLHTQNFQRTNQGFSGCQLRSFVNHQYQHSKDLDYTWIKLNMKQKFDVKRILRYRGEACAFDWPDSYCRVASNIDSATTTLFSISATEAKAFSYLSCIYIIVLKFKCNHHSCNKKLES